MLSWVDNVVVLGYWDTSLELGEEPELWELLDRADVDMLLSFPFVVLETNKKEKLEI